MSLRFLTDDWTLKLFSLGTAVLLYLFVTVENDTPREVDFRIYYDPDDDLMVTNNAPTVLRATLQGPWMAFRSLEMNDLEPVIIDLHHAEPGTQRRIIDVTAVNPPGGMRAVAVRPSEVEITLDRRVERQVPVHPDIPEGPAFGYEILDVRIVPPRARVVGPGAKMQSIDFITTRTIDVAGREEDLKVEVDLRPPPPPLSLVDKRVQVFVEVGEEFVQRTFQGVPVRADNAPKTSRVTPASVTLTLKGPRRTVDRIAKDSLEAFIDVGAEFEDGETNVEKPVQVRPVLPERTQLVAPVPKIEVQLVQPKRGRRR